MKRERLRARRSFNREELRAGRVVVFIHHEGQTADRQVAIAASQEARRNSPADALSFRPAREKRMRGLSVT
jgi:hypothetical protein